MEEVYQKLSQVGEGTYGYVIRFITFDYMIVLVKYIKPDQRQNRMNMLL